MPRVSSQIVPDDGTGSPDSKFSAGWQLIQSGVEENLFSVHFANSTHGFIGGALTRCLKSTNGGINWSPVAVPSYADFQSVWATSSNDAYLGGWDSIYSTHNGGTTWAGSYTHTMNYAINDLQFLSPDDGFGFLSWTLFVKTTDGGNSWSEPTGGFTAWDFFSGYMLDQNTGWAVGDCGVIAKTTDGGENWTPYEWNGWIDHTCVPLWGVHATSELNAWAVADSGIAFRTTDGGITWSRNIIAGDEDRLTDVYFINANLGYIVGFNGKIFKTTDGGDSWIQEPQLTSFNLNSVFFISDKLGWVVGDNGTILRYEGTNGGVRKEDNKGVTGLNIFPNPATGQSTISFNLAEKKQVKLEIRDISGKVLKNIYNGELMQGEHEMRLNLANLSNGIYLGHLSTQGESICKIFIINN